MILIHTNCKLIVIVPSVSALKWTLFYLNLYEKPSIIYKFIFWIGVSLGVLFMFKTINVPKGKKYNMQPTMISFK